MANNTYVTTLQKEFAFYQKSRNYFEALFNKNKGNITDTYNEIIGNIKKDWQNVNLDWVVVCLKNIKKLIKYGIEIDINSLEKIINKYPEIDKLLSSLFTSKEKYNNDDLEKMIQDPVVVDFLYMYTIIKGIYDEVLLIWMMKMFQMISIALMLLKVI